MNRGLIPTRPTFGDEIKDIMDALNSVSEQTTATLDERRFKEVFLPFFAEGKNPFGVDMFMWATIAGGWQRPVNIIDPHGNVVAKVPPIMDGKAINTMTAGRDMPSIFHVVLSSDQYSRISPGDGARYLEEQLTRRAFIMHNVEADLDKLKAWDKLLTQYGYEPIIPPTLAKAIAEDEAEQNGSETKHPITIDATQSDTIDSWEVL